MENEYPQFLYNEGKKAASLVPESLLMSPWIEPLAFKDDIVLVKLLCSFSYTDGDPKTYTNLYLYNIATRSLEKLCTAERLQCQLGFMIAVPYSMSLAPLV
ncbi:hypothetical protein FRX31_003625 [Thalictrum thalictroides]|uniref:Uncharacterized protein n=1 Tax=Thalictrum thalictroides TaxID=46969 RepID=A0A7J6XAF1_THATH|nr:hypothetical protein FRX31_003625 [Thalictrum thalictroides]